jgi:hypothetical protein
MKAKAVNDLNRFVILELPAPATHKQRQQIAHRIATALEGDEPTRLQARVDVLNRCIDSIRELCEDNVCNVPYLRVVMDEIAMIGPMYERAAQPPGDGQQ